MTTHTPARGSTTTQRDYLPAERQDMILSLLTRQSVATVPELAELLRTTDITVRRDLAVLAKAGLLKRVRGGAMSVSGAAVPTAPGAAPAPAAADADDDVEAAESIAQPGDSTGATTPRVPELSQDQPAIGVLLPEPSFFWPKVVDGIRAFAARQGVRVITRESSYEPDVDDAALLKDLAVDPTVCGILAAPSAHPGPARAAWDWIMEAPVPVVAIERAQPLLAPHTIDAVRTNHHEGVRKAAAHFLRHGHHRIGAAFSETPTSDQIQDGWNRVLARTDLIECPFQLSGIPPYSTAGVDQVADAIADSGVTAMLVHSDYLAIAVAQALERRGLEVPGDVSLISIDGFATPSSRPLTVLRSADQELARAAVDTILGRIQRPEAPTRQVFVDPRLVDRGSVSDIR